MVRIYNETEDTYITLAAYITAYDAEDEDVYHIHFYYNVNDLFASAKKLTAYRGRFAKDEAGKPMLEAYTLTDDEEDYFMENLEPAAGEVYKKLLGWAKNVFDAYRFNESFDFGLEEESIIMAASPVTGYDAGPPTVWTFTAGLTPEMITMMARVTSGALLGEEAQIENIDDDTDMTVSDDIGDVSGLNVEVYEMVPSLEGSIQYFVPMPVAPYFDLFEVVDNKISEALVLFCVKEWYLINRLMDDHQIENLRCAALMNDIRSLLDMKTEPTRRTNWFFKDN